jgi:hypothetical protein
MPKYALFRDFPPTLSRTELDGMVIATQAALQSYIYRGEAYPSTVPHGINWVRSYWQPGGSWGMCVFEAPNLSVLSAFQDACAAAFIDAMEVEETASNLSVPTPIAVTVPLAFGNADPLSSAEEAVGLSRRDVGRVYWNGERKTVIALVACEPAAETQLEIATGVIELKPAEYA